MSEYLSFGRQEVSESTIEEYYNKGYVLTRLGKGIMDQTRSLRIALQDWKLNSENRRVLKKTSELSISHMALPLEDYSWEIHKLGKDFYTNKFGKGTMSASKIKELFQDQQVSNMNSVFVYKHSDKKIGYALSYTTADMCHYAYPFYDLDISKENPNIGMGMMIRAIEWAKNQNKKYMYLGSVTTEQSLYKLQFKGLEWFDELTQSWSGDLDKLKERVRS